MDLSLHTGTGSTLWRERKLAQRLKAEKRTAKEERKKSVQETKDHQCPKFTWDNPYPTFTHPVTFSHTTAPFHTTIPSHSTTPSLTTAPYHTTSSYTTNPSGPSQVTTPSHTINPSPIRGGWSKLPFPGGLRGGMQSPDQPPQPQVKI